MPLQKVRSTRSGWSEDTGGCKHTHRVTHTITSLLCWSNGLMHRAGLHQSWMEILSVCALGMLSWGVRSPTRTIWMEKSESSSNSAHCLEEKYTQVSPPSCNIPLSGTGPGKDIVNSSSVCHQHNFLNNQWGIQSESESWTQFLV